MLPDDLFLYPRRDNELQTALAEERAVNKQLRLVLSKLDPKFLETFPPPPVAAPIQAPTRAAMPATRFVQGLPIPNGGFNPQYRPPQPAFIRPPQSIQVRPADAQHINITGPTGVPVV